jgi:hypothetical protein
LLAGTMGGWTVCCAGAWYVWGKGAGTTGAAAGAASAAEGLYDGGGMKNLDDGS